MRSNLSSQTGSGLDVLICTQSPTLVQECSSEQATWRAHMRLFHDVGRQVPPSGLQGRQQLGREQPGSSAHGLKVNAHHLAADVACAAAALGARQRHGKAPVPLPSIPTHLERSTVSAAFRFWKYCRIALACCRWYSMVTPEGSAAAAAAGAASAGAAAAPSAGAAGRATGFCSSGSLDACTAASRRRQGRCGRREGNGWCEEGKGNHEAPTRARRRHKRSKNKSAATKHQPASEAGP